MADIDKALPNTRTELKVPGQEQDVEIQEQEQQKGPVEVTPEEDGGATIDFESKCCKSTRHRITFR